MSQPPKPDLFAGTSPAEALTELALNLRWSWNPSERELWGQLDAELWELTHNPWAVLQTVSRQKLQAALDDPAFCQRLGQLLQAKREAVQAPRWFSSAFPDPPLKTIAYFSMEYMLSEALPIY